MSITISELTHLLTVKHLKSVLDLYGIETEQKLRKEDLQNLIRESKRIDAGLVVRHLFADSNDRAAFMRKVENLRKKNKSESGKRVSKDLKTGGVSKRGPRKQAKKKSGLDEESLDHVDRDNYNTLDQPDDRDDNRDDNHSENSESDTYE